MFTLVKAYKGEYSEKGSLFSAYALPLQSLLEVKKKIGNFKKTYSDVNHICYAYRLETNSGFDEFSTDAGEPNGCAGIPILNVLKRHELVNVSLFVLRFFGGSKLGIPGLIHAYTNVAEQLISNAKVITWVKRASLSLFFEYNFQRRVEAVLKQFKVIIISCIYKDLIQVRLEVDMEKCDVLNNKLSEITNGTIRVERISKSSDIP